MSAPLPTPEQTAAHAVAGAGYALATYSGACLSTAASAVRDDRRAVASSVRVIVETIESGDHATGHDMLDDLLAALRGTGEAP